MDGDLEKVYMQVMDATQPEDLFGSEDVVLPESNLLEFLRAKYEQMKVITTPANYVDTLDIEAASDADAKLERLYALAQTRMVEHVYGIEGRGAIKPAYANKSFQVGQNRYYIGRRLEDGRHSAHYEAFLERDEVIIGRVLLKLSAVDSGNDKDVGTITANNECLNRELRNLDVLHEKQVPLWMHLPFIMDKFQSGGRMGLVFRQISGYSLTEVRKHSTYAGGIDQKHMIWMLDRMLRCLGYVHDQGVVHGNLSPDHVRIQPPTHNVVLTGWSAGVHEPAVSGERLLDVPASPFTAPEVRTNGRIGPWSDIYSLGKLMIWVLGGDPTSNQLPQSAQVEEPIIKFLLRMIKEDPYERPANAWKLWEEQVQIKDRLWKPKFLPFVIN